MANTRIRCPKPLLKVEEIKKPVEESKKKRRKEK